MFKNILLTMSDYHIWPVISLVFFVLFFTGMLWWTMRLKKSYVEEMGQAPLEDNELK